jgi:3-deoxy-D-manno-octulosonic-acid transferase
MEELNMSKGTSNVTSEDVFSAWPYRWGLLFYRVAVVSFFMLGGLTCFKKKYEVDFDQRLGKYDSKIPQNAVWVHAASVGEVQLALPFIEMMLKSSKLPYVLSTITPTGRSAGEQAMPAGTLIYAPWDVQRYVTRALDALMPKIYVAIEAERWPNMLAELHARGVPTFLVNGRLSATSAKKLGRQRRFWRGVLSCFDRLLVRFESDAEQFLSLGVPEGKILVTGDCKIDALFSRKAKVDEQKWRRLRNGSAPLFLAASTHEGEEDTVLDAFAKVRLVYPNARLVISPRHTERVSSVVNSTLPFGKVVLLSQAGETSEWDITIVDKIIGTFLDLYSAMDAAFVGGSLVPDGGHNIMEPAMFSIQTTHGPSMHDFPDAARMDAQGAAYLVRNAEDLAEKWIIATAPEERERVHKACKSYFGSVGGAFLRSWEIIEKFLAAR